MKLPDLKTLLTPVSDEEEKDNLLKYRLVLEVTFWIGIVSGIFLAIFWTFAKDLPVWTWGFYRQFMLYSTVILGSVYIIVFHHLIPERWQLIPLLSQFETFVIAFLAYLMVRFTDGLFITGGFLKASGVTLAPTSNTYYFLFLPLMTLGIGLQAEMLLPTAFFIGDLIILDIIYDFLFGSGFLASEAFKYPIAMSLRILYILLFAYFARYLTYEAKKQRQARAKLERLDQQKNMFVELAAHNLRTPITSIRGYLTVLLEETTSFKEKERLFLKQAVENSHKLQEISEKLIRVSELETEGWQGKRETVDLTALVKEVTDSYQRQAQEKKVKILFPAPPESLTTSLNPEQVKMALDCLINNAIKFNKDQGRVNVRLQKDEEHIVGEINIPDVDFPQNKLTKIFEKPQVRFALRPKDAEEGIGLYLTRLIFYQHGGDLTVTSLPTKGLTFIFKLPIVSELLPQND